MPSIYLESSDYAGYGVPNATAVQVQQASSIINGYLVRPEGLIWSPDGNGNPCYMAGMTASVQLASVDSINVGLVLTVLSNTVTVSGTINPTQTCIIIVNGVSYSYTALISDTVNSIATKFTTLIPNSTTTGAVITISNNPLTIVTQVVAQNVNVTVTGAIQAIQPGFVLILDRANTGVTEACIVNAINGNVIQLINVQFPHAANCTMELGLTIFEEVQMPQGRPIKTLSKTPVMMALSGQGRYGYPRRGSSGAATVNEYNLLAAITQFGGPPIWEIFNQSLIGIDPTTGTIWVPAGIMLEYYTEIRINYIAGYTYYSLPSQIKQACAMIITASSAFPMNGAISSLRAGDTAVTRFAATTLSNDVKEMLNPFRSRLFV